MSTKMTILHLHQTTTVSFLIISNSISHTITQRYIFQDTDIVVKCTPTPPPKKKHGWGVGWGKVT